MLANAGEAIGAKYEQLKTEVQNAKASGLWVLQLDPTKVHPGKLADRIRLSLDPTDPRLMELKRTLLRDGQIQPISVRTIEGSDGEYEIVSGHRRHAAALQLNAEQLGGFKIHAVLDGSGGDAAHKALRMYVENAARMDLSAYELGQAFRRWLDDKLFENQDAIATATGLSKGTVSKYIALATLPEPVISAFGDPRAISMRWGEQLVKAAKDHGPALLELAQKLAAGAPKPPEEVLRALLDAGRPETAARAVKTESVSYRGRTLYKVTPKGNGFAIKFGAKLAPDVARQAQEKVKQVLTEYLGDVQKDGK